ncbi:type IV pilus modification protein PilV [Lysobacter sp. CAU 1642]|uniref:Type IV pilus modification protein PilV n=2 Tax=Pseudomarimonas salicorniae TaxID=2933270 RepID=A0ABT0GFB1_9GAMM|nr:type IV pilus modification protein PilV [Lysobacter sp. CAU 1642]
MIEILVAILILSVGLLGMAALMASSLRNSQSANFRSQATNLAYNYMDMMRANGANAPNYARTGFTNPAVCPAAPAAFDISDCGNQHTCDRSKWARELCTALPNGRGRAQVTAVGSSGYYDVQVEVCWSDDRSEGGVVTTDCDGDGETSFILESRI